jgi:hypothetical protein
MTTIYKTKYEFHGSTYVLCFSLPENIKKQMDDWETALDKVVFDEQIMTGSFRGKFSIHDAHRSLMEKLREKGIIQPYYGAINAGACTYALQVTPPTCTIGAEHTVVEVKTSFEDTVTILQAEASEVARNHKPDFMIKEQEYQSLQKWDLWNAADEFTSRYIYRFSPTSIGLGLEVMQTLTKEQIDITDYDEW